MKLNEYISIGFCTSYGDADYRVSMNVMALSRKELDDLILCAFHALRVAEDTWKNCQVEMKAAKNDTPQAI